MFEYVIVVEVSEVGSKASVCMLDVRGSLSYGALVAREYGIPVVLGGGDVMKRIICGQMINVEGSKVKVYLETGEDSKN